MVLNTFMILCFSTLLILILLIICLSFISKHKQKAIQIITFESFINSPPISENHKKGFIDTINDFFDNNSTGTIDGIENDDSDVGGDDGGE